MTDTLTDDEYDAFVSFLSPEEAELEAAKWDAKAKGLALKLKNHSLLAARRHRLRRLEILALEAELYSLQLRTAYDELKWELQFWDLSIAAKGGVQERFLRNLMKRVRSNLEA
jgi:hypothetical protein